MRLSFLGRAHYPPAEFPRFVADADKCTRCGRCVRTCPTHIIQLSEDGPPRIVGYKGLEVACLGCRNCEAVCAEGAVRVEGVYRVSAGRYKTIHTGRVELPNPFAEREPPPFSELEGKLTETERVILKRRSVRLFQKKPVSEDLIRRCLEAARYAPSSGNDRCWEFVVIRDQELIRWIERSCLKALKLMSEHYLQPKSLAAKMIWNLYSLWKPGDMDVRVVSGMDTVVMRDSLFFGAPVVIVILQDRRGIGQPVLDAGICAQNLVLASHALGLGTCYVGFITALNSVPDRKLMRELGAVYPMRLVTSIALGWPDDTFPANAVVSERKSVKEAAVFVGFDD
jgi:nitroreductase/NAD-dependent dihydropyrimidine dehydrogenase PreA subunit